jgi:hypothetical protein
MTYDGAVAAPIGPTEGGLVATLLVVNTSPYGSEGPCNALRLASALALGDEPVDVATIHDLARLTLASGRRLSFASRPSR